ncbi:hypothetical protein Lepto7376_3519 [[Leptolyngbya] sp. PCC 7376]|uniref:DUF6398 domain-containing protein n=1 Tax=[Leptolyngbya] sp. PCC 7376 TaxID=111781 RepID=UPI00029F46E0|nr:DUF6398 domain-containing protein [[Leptolyngbya] sp. PCC 7376]AFY39716.1 hypothetical protein Lepto7376_3519 [[Leptolyngbya] sp. PCC 7376]
MAQPTQSEKVPQKMQAKYDEIVAITNTFAAEYLNEDYAQLVRYATAALARKRPSPLSKGRAKSWACGITHAIGMVNFLYDPSVTPHMKASELYKAFGVATSTGQGKSKTVRETLDLMQMDPDWSTQETLKYNPLATTVVINGQIIDASLLPRQIQEMLHESGMLPVIPETSNEDIPVTIGEPEAIALEDMEPRQPPVAATKDDIFHFEVFIFDGLLTDEFIEANPVVCREIEILGKHTLADFHRIIFKAFDREEEHMYEFQVRGSAPNAPDAERYVLPEAMNNSDDENKPSGCVNDTVIADLNLSLDDVIGYHFDFGDSWWHQINLLEVKSKPSGRKKYPRITVREGASPPQYPDFE